MEQPLETLRRPLLIAFSTILLVLVFYLTGLLQVAENWSYDQRMMFSRANTQIDDRIAVVLIDDASLKAMAETAGSWPWPRSIYADLLDYFSLAEPKAVLFDITFTEKRLFESAKESINPHDLRLVEASQMYPFTYHAMRLVVDQEDELNHDLLNIPMPENVRQKFSITERYRNLFGIDDFNISLTAPTNNVYYLPFAELSEAALSAGVVDMNGDSDGTYRRARLIHRYGNDYYPALSTTSLIDSLLPKRIVNNNGTILFGDIKIPVDEDERYWVNYYNNYQSYSFSGIIASQSQIINGDIEHLLVDPQRFKDKIVFIGASAAGLEDLKRTPMDANLPGVLVHASIASNILNQDFVTPPNKTITIILIIILSLVTAFASLIPKQAWLKNIIPPIVLAVFVLVALFIFNTYSYVIEIAAPSMSIVLSWVISFSFLVFTEGKEKRRFKRMMSQYLSPAVLQTVVGRHEEFAKAEVGSKENITMLFSDIRSFTNMSEKMPPEEVVNLLNHYFSAMTDSIFHYEGTIDKFIGDAIMAFWGAPIKTDDHADKATLSALDMIHRLAQVNAWTSENNYPPLAIGIGLHTGDAILGNIGSENKLDYTIIGDNVNLASRIEGLTKTYHSQILISEDTYHRLKLDIPCLILDLVRVKGKQHPIKVYRPLAHPTLSSEQELQQAIKQATLGEQAFQAYLRQDWDEAQALWRQLPQDPAIDAMIERCDYFRASPPPDDWDGAHTMTSK